jgi:DNA (cytosine-5)-methyltransferase 1
VLTIGSLFSGIGGLELGLERAGLGPVIWQAESDPFARKVLAKHWPGVKCYEDVRDIDERAERPGIICGGFPCQDISNAGKRVGIGGERSGLWSEYARIVRILRPRFVLVENVPALLGRGLGRVLGDLAESGLDAEWDVLGADAFGATQHRERVWILAYPDDAGFQGPVWAGQPPEARPERETPHSEPLRSRSWTLAARTSFGR